jgi:hypothetical protein
MTKPSISLSLLALFLLANAGGAAEPAKVETLPMPREIKAYVIPMGSMRTNRYDVWQYHEVDRFGRFRPLVIQSPHGAYYRYNGQPYPWASTQPLDWKIMIIE